MNMPEWISRAKPVERATVEVGFLLAETFYFGPANKFTPEQWQTLREPLYQPATERYGQYLLSAAAADSPGELIKHYADVLRLRDKHQKQWPHQPSYFWHRPLIFSRGHFAVDFPWYDTWQEATPLLDALEMTSDGEVFSDMEQGWDVTIFASNGRSYIRQGNFDTGEERQCVSCDRTELARQVPSLRDRCVRLLDELRTALGHDYWTHD